MSMYKSLVATILGATIVLGSATVQAETQKPQFSKEQVYNNCLMFADIAYGAYKEYQANQTASVAKQNLYKTMINEKMGSEYKELLKNIIDISVDNTANLPVAKTKQEKEQLLREYSSGVMASCIEDMGYKVSDFQ